MDRPSIFEFASIASFTQAMLAWKRANDPRFSLRKAAKDANLSHSLISCMAAGKHRLTRDR